MSVRPVAAGAVLLLSGCGVAGSGTLPPPSATRTLQTPAPVTTSAPDAAPSVGGGVATVPGFGVGEVPPVPALVVPDLVELTDAQQGLEAALSTALTDLPGVTVRPAYCDPTGAVLAAGGTTLYGDGSGSVTGAAGRSVAYGDGSGSKESTDGSLTWNYGDGSGSFVRGGLEVWNYGDGSGSWTDGDSETWLYGDGSGSDVAPGRETWNYGDGSGSSTIGGVTVWNHGDGSGSYEDGTVSVRNDGDGTGAVDGVPVEVDPLPPLPPLGEFPPLPALQPLDPVCGSVLVLPDSVLFDFDRAELRPASAPVLDAVAASLAAAAEAGGSRDVQVDGHTDALGSDAYNLDLSQRRAASVVEALQDRSVGQQLVPTGRGESSPVAPNLTAAGADDPAGRQLNRRVEIVVPAG